MPVKVSDYSNSSIYKICCNDASITDVYVGSTTAFSKRKCQHKAVCNNTRNAKHNLYVYQFIRENGGWENWSMILVENYNATNKRHLESRERYWLETLKATLNKQVPTRTRKQYREKNKESIKQYRDEHKDKNQEYNAIYYRSKQFARKLHGFIYS